MAAPDSSPTSRTGSCLCGAVKYTLTGQPLIAVACHCVNCQKGSGAPFSNNAIFEDTNVNISDHGENLTIYKDSDTDSGASLIRHFCKSCGTTVYITQEDSSSFAGKMAVAVGTIDGEKASFKPQMQLYCHNRYPWMPVLEGVSEKPPAMFQRDSDAAAAPAK